jgi:hypothetical protein
MVLQQFSTDSINSLDEVYNYVSNQSILFFMNYLNAVFFTIATTVLFVAFFLYFSPNSTSPWLLIALIFVPIYSIMNIFVYGAQITVIPMLLLLMEVVEYQNVIKGLILMLTQFYPGTIVNTINLLAYGVLAVPSIIFAFMLFKESNIAKKISGILLGLNGISCIISIVALMSLFYPLAAITSMFGVFLTLLSLISLVIGLIWE